MGKKWSKVVCIRKGKKLITANQKDWERCCNIRFSDLYEGDDVNCFLDLVAAWRKGAGPEDIKKMVYDQNHSGSSFAMVKAMSKSFCPQIYDWIV